MAWSKAMNYMLAMCIYRQQVRKANGQSRRNWPAVVELVNATFTRFPSFMLSYPNGVDAARLQGQYNDRHRPHATKST
jgi:hypothetical protein